MWRLWSLFKIFRHDLLIMLISLKNPATPKRVKQLLVLVLVYLISPIDIIPDTIPFVGVLDDAVVVPAAITFLMRMLPYSVKQDSENKAWYLKKHAPLIIGIVSVVIVLWVILVIWGIYKLFVQ